MLLHKVDCAIESARVALQPYRLEADKLKHRGIGAVVLVIATSARADKQSATRVDPRDDAFCRGAAHVRVGEEEHVILRKPAVDGILLNDNICLQLCVL